MPEYDTLFEFLEKTGARVHAYDLGRRVSRLGRETFIGFEKARQPYPLPMQRKAWFGLVQLAEEPADEPVIWFLRLDLDEQGLLVQAERDYLLKRLLESAQARSSGADPQFFLQDNPYAFSPRDDRMALFHALLSVELDRPASRYYAHALDYFRGTPGWDQWSFVGYQGIADVACRHADEPLSTAISRLPKEPLVALCHCLESRRLSANLADALRDRLDQALSTEETDISLLAALIRAFSGDLGDDRTTALFGRVLEHGSASSIEILAALSGRTWELLRQGDLLNRYLERLAGNDHGQDAFTHCVSDLLSLPELAGDVRQALRDPTQSDAVREAFGRMLAGNADT